MSSRASSLRSTIIVRLARAVVNFPRSQRYRRLRERMGLNTHKFTQYFAESSEPKLHLGCGKHQLVGWLNTDYFPEDDKIPHLDLTKQFPLHDNSMELVFSEHVIEHLTLAGGINMLRESFRVLKPGGRLRVSTPSLLAMLDIYKRPDEPLNRAYFDWHAGYWLTDAEVCTPAVLLNDFVRNWDHMLIYDHETLSEAMKLAGFIDVVSCELQQSDDPRLANIENETRMPAGLLALHTMTFEGTKPDRSQLEIGAN